MIDGKPDAEELAFLDQERAKPYHALVGGAYRCLLCGNFADNGHIFGKHHRKAMVSWRATQPSEWEAIPAMPGAEVMVAGDAMPLQQRQQAQNELQQHASMAGEAMPLQQLQQSQQQHQHLMQQEQHQHELQQQLAQEKRSLDEQALELQRQQQELLQQAQQLQQAQVQAQAQEQHRQLQQQEMLQQHHQAVAEEQQAQAAFCIGFHFSGDVFEGQ